MRRFTHWSLVFGCALSLALMGCDSGDEPTGDGSGAASVNADSGSSTSVTAEGSTEGSATETSEAGEETETPATKPSGWDLTGSISDVTPMEIPADCGFDDALQGSGMNQHIANMKFYGLELADGGKEKYQLHYDCGGEAKAVWIFLSTGWCGACNSYAKTVEKMYNEYKDEGLRVLWIVSEDANRDPITVETFAEYVVAHGPMSFSVVRDPNFNGVYSDLDNTSPSLPHQYLLDATTMELIYKQGGTAKEGVMAVTDQLGVDPAGVEALLGISFSE